MKRKRNKSMRKKQQELPREGDPVLQRGNLWRNPRRDRESLKVSVVLKLPTDRALQKTGQ